MKYYIIRNKDELGNFIFFKNNINDSNKLSINMVNKYDEVDKNDNYKIIPTTIDDYNSHSISEYIFNTNMDTINILNNKSIFSEFMLNNFRDNYPLCYYYNYDNTNFEHNIDDIEIKKIQKNNTGFGGIQTKIIYKIDTTQKNIVVTKYYEHYTYYAGHFLVKDGLVLKSSIFVNLIKNFDENFIKCGAMDNFDIVNLVSLIEYDTFSNILKILNFSGICCIDFIIDNNKIIIFEINPRMGDSLIKYPIVLNDFLECMLLNFT